VGVEISASLARNLATILTAQSLHSNDLRARRAKTFQSPPYFFTFFPEDSGAFLFLFYRVYLEIISHESIVMRRMYRQ